MKNISQIHQWAENVLPEKLEGKSDEIPVVQELIEQLEISGCIVVADALNCQKKTARAINSRKCKLSTVRKGQPRNLEKGYRGLCVGRSSMEKHVQGIQNREKLQQD